MVLVFKIQIFVQGIACSLNCTVCTVQLQYIYMSVSTCPCPIVLQYQAAAAAKFVVIALLGILPNLQLL